MSFSFALFKIMEVDKNIWQLIADQIDDPKTFQNFSLVCKMFAKIAKTISPQKKMQYAKEVKQFDFPTCPCCGIDEIRGFKLPNRNWHGVYEYYDTDFKLVTRILYDNGIELSKEVFNNMSSEDE